MTQFTRENIANALKLAEVAGVKGLKDGLDLLQRFDVTGHRIVGFTELQERFKNFPVTAFYAEGVFYFNNAQHVFDVMGWTYSVLQAAIDYDYSKVKLDFRTVVDRFVFMVPDVPVLAVDNYESEQIEDAFDDFDDEDEEDEVEDSVVDIENALKASDDAELEEDADIDDDENFQISVDGESYDCEYGSFVRLFKAMEDVFWELNPDGKMSEEVFAVKTRVTTLAL